MSVLNMVYGGGGGGLDPSNALICVVAETGSTVSFTKNSVVYATIPASGSFPNAKDDFSSDYYYSIPPSDYGSWVVSAVINNSTVSVTITVNTNKTYAVALGRVFLIKDGKFNSMFNATLHGPSSSSLSENANGYVQLSSSRASSTYSTCVFDKYVDVTDFSYLYMDYQARGYYSTTNQCPAFGFVSSIGSGADHTTFSPYTMLLSARASSMSTRSTQSVNIANQTGEKRIAFQEAGTSTSPAVYGDIYCYNLYLSRV